MEPSCWRVHQFTTRSVPLSNKHFIFRFPSTVHNLANRASGKSVACLVDIDYDHTLDVDDACLHVYMSLTVASHTSTYIHVRVFMPLRVWVSPSPWLAS